ncbi:MAG TPA: dihydropteroate synthase [Dehalococcoidia bacterium]|nr:dihydropteroate synthase [Dehalococcoidia bacterium]
MLIIGEKINASNRHVAEAIVARNSTYIADMAKAQADAGADYIDVNVGTGNQSQQKQVADMEWVVDVVQTATDRSLSIDSDFPGVIEAALRKYSGAEIMINSVNAETGKLDAISRLVTGHNVKIVALAMGAEGIPRSVEKRLAACESIVNHLARFNINEEQVYFDPLVLPVSVDSGQALITLQTIERIKTRYPHSESVIGLSNISYGLPCRKLINQAFLVMAAHAGLDAAILDPLDVRTMSLLKAADVLTEKDPQCRRYTRAYRKGTLVA